MYSAIPDDDDKVSHLSHIFKRGKISNPTSSVENLSVCIKVALFHIRCAGSWDASVHRGGKPAFNVTWPVTWNSATLWTQTSCAVIRVFLPGGGDKTRFRCLLLVHRICSASDKFLLMTIKLLYAFSDKADRVKSEIFPPFLKLLINVRQQNTFNNHQNSGCV